MEAYEVFDKFLEQKRMYRFEGESGVRNLERIVETLGYGEGFMRNRAIEEFLTDNPGAVEAVVQFISEWVERNSDWEDRLRDELYEEVEDEESEDA